jgi:hypothetical protein
MLGCQRFPRLMCQMLLAHMHLRMPSVPFGAETARESSTGRTCALEQYEEVAAILTPEIQPV